MRLLKIYITFVITLNLHSQNAGKYWVLFKDKELGMPAKLSPACIANRKMLGLDTVHYTDYPVSSQYLATLKQHDVTVHHKSKWLNAVSATLVPSQLVQIQQLPFVSAVIPIQQSMVPASMKRNHLFGKSRKRRKKGTAAPEPSEALKLINYTHLESHGYTGKDVVIGVTDAGYTNLDKQDYFKKAIEENRVLGTRDFLNPSREVGLFENLTGKDTHGREVVKCIAGKSDKEQYGVAFDAKFYLARTENAKGERRQEEDAWVVAMEWFDSLGVRLVNSSLGYGKAFDIPSESYGTHQMNGYSTVIAKAAQIATLQKEMIIVNSAGNSGSDKEWKGYISSPADVPSVVSVGATDAYSSKMSYSSIGPEYNGFLKPDIAAFSKNGTSFSSPLVAGIVACMLQKHSSWCNDQIKNALYTAGNLYPFKNNYIGYGVPDCNRLVQALKQKPVPDSTVWIYATDSLYKLQEITLLAKLGKGDKFVVFRTQAPGFVLDSDVFEANKQSFEFKRMTGEDYCILLSGTYKIVVQWPETYREDKQLQEDGIAE